MEDATSTNHKPTILYVDDDRENLRTFRRLFRQQYDVLLAESGAEGLELLREHSPIPVIITDQRMPEMTGIEFLENTIRLSPASIRIIITGFTDVQALIDAINTGQVYRYITKPWDEQELYVTIKRALENYRLKRHNEQLLVDLQRQNQELEASYQTLQETQDKLIQAEKMASIGRLASRIAHELRNPIQGVRMGIELLKQELQELPDALKANTSCSTTLQHVDQEIMAANKIIQDLLEYARDMTFEYTHTDVNAIVEGILFNLSEQIAQQAVTVQTNYGEVGTIRADGIRIRQALLNIMRNAVEAMSTGQSAGNAQAGGALIVTTAPHPDADAVVITVQDTGCGMTPEQQQRVFEPFFTTKEQGVGVGMSIVHRILEAHDGTIALESQQGRGTTFTITLQRAGRPE
jgi:two-component system, sensor histidine kinase and response regulator